MTTGRKIQMVFFKSLMIAATAIIVSSLLVILWTIISKGFSTLSWELISKPPEGGSDIGKTGGILNAIVGSIYITLGSTILGLLISIPVVLYINVYAKKNSLFTNITRLTFDVLFGIPSIVYGAFGFAIMVYYGLKTSLLGGILTVTLLIIPILARAMDEVIRLAPDELSDANYSLGGTRWETSVILLRQSIPGILTAILLSFGRAIGDAASVMFTAGYTDKIPTSLKEDAATLPLSIFFNLSSPIQEVQDRAYGAAVVLTVIVLILSLASKYFSKKFSKFKI
jgi:phosphate transport system permease protein